MLEVPQRRLFGTRDEFADAFNLAMAELQIAYDALPIGATVPDWAHDGLGESVFHVDLPTDMAKTVRGAYALLRALLLGLKTKNKTLHRIARVEHDGMTTLWAETNHGGRAGRSD